MVGDAGLGDYYALDTARRDSNDESPVVIWSAFRSQDGEEIEVVASDFGSFFGRAIEDELGSGTLGGPPALGLDRGPGLGSGEMLEPSQNEGYGDWRLPSFRDEEIAHLLERVSTGGFNKRDLNAAHAPVLRAFAERMATLAKRRESPSDMRLGLQALALAANLDDLREALVVMPLLWRTAEVLDLDPAEEFVQAAESHGCATLGDFASRTPQNRSIESMGYIETVDESGFRYERTW